MIILDANIIRGTKLGGPEDELLRTIRLARTERVAVPRIALEEVLAQRVLAYNRAHEAATSGAEQLNIATPWATVKGPDEHAPERVREHWREQYAHVAEVLETSIEVHQEALFREANQLAPCKLVGKDKTGARDAAIWLTAVEYAKQHPDQSVFFVSNNHNDFGKQAGAIPRLAEDIKGMEDRFFLYTSLGDVLARFGRAIRTTEGEVRSQLSRSESLEVLARRARFLNMRERIESLRPMLPEDRPVSLLTQSARAVLAEVEDPRAYKIGDHTWCTATARWLITDQIPATSSAEFYELLSWKTRVMVSPSDHNVTILKSYGIEQASPDDRSYFPGFTGTWFDPKTVASNVGQALLQFTRVVSTLSDEFNLRVFHGEPSLDRPRDMPEADDFPEDYVPDDDA